jgi:hypothetical protein
MGDYNQPRYADLDFIKSTDGTFATRADGSAGGPSGNLGSMGRSLAANTTYYVVAGNADAPAPAMTELICWHFKWDANVIVTLTIEMSCFADFIQGNRHGPVDVSNNNVVAGNWIQENPSSAVISTTSTDASTGGATVTNSTIAVAGGTAGGCTLQVGNVGARRVRMKAVVAGTGGVVRAAFNGKLGA